MNLKNIILDKLNTTEYIQSCHRRRIAISSIRFQSNKLFTVLVTLQLFKNHSNYESWKDEADDIINTIWISCEDGDRHHGITIDEDSLRHYLINEPKYKLDILVHHKSNEPLIVIIPDEIFEKTYKILEQLVMDISKNNIQEVGEYL